MSYHVLHLHEHGLHLHKDRGQLVAVNSANKVRKLPIEDIRAIVIAAKGVVLSNELLSALLENDSIILYLGEKYQAVGYTAAISRLTQAHLVEIQLSKRSKINKSIWNEIIKAKIENQSQVMSLMSPDTENPINRFLGMIVPDEATAARVYWSGYFKILRQSEIRGPNRDRTSSDLINVSLNYGYAILSALVHRSLLVHGFIPQLGIHHKYRFRSLPLVYDLMEPFRPFVDLHIFDVMNSNINFEDEKEYFKALAQFHQKPIIYGDKFKIKIVDSIDYYVRAIANALGKESTKGLWIPRINRGFVYASDMERV